MVMFLIIMSLTPSVAQTSMAFETIEELWENLKERFAQSDAYRIANLQT